MVRRTVHTASYNNGKIVYCTGWSGCDCVLQRKQRCFTVNRGAGLTVFYRGKKDSILYIQVPYDCVAEERKIVYCTYRSPMTVLQRKER